MLFNQNEPETVCWPGSTRTYWGAQSAPPDPLIGLGRDPGRVEENEEGKGSRYGTAEKEEMGRKRREKKRREEVGRMDRKGKGRTNLLFMPPS